VRKLLENSDLLCSLLSMGGACVLRSDVLLVEQMKMGELLSFLLHPVEVEV
jgi:hypothetical protein